MLDGIGAVNYTIRQPIGVAGLISPWNLPLYLLTFKIAPAIACGNTVVIFVALGFIVAALARKRRVLQNFSKEYYPVSSKLFTWLLSQVGDI